MSLVDNLRIPIGDRQFRSCVRIPRSQAGLSAHARVLRKYFKEGKLTTPIADRSVNDEFISMTHESGALRRVETTFRVPTTPHRQRATAVGFVMTIYRRRLASSSSHWSRALTGTSGLD